MLQRNQNVSNIHNSIMSPLQMNTLSKPLMAEFDQIIQDVENDVNVKSIVLISGKPECFIAGADIRLAAPACVHSPNHFTCSN